MPRSEIALVTALALLLVFVQIQDIDRIWWMSIVATLMSFTYSFIGLGECIAQAARELNIPSLMSSLICTTES